MPHGHGSLALSITGRDRFRPIARARHRNARLHARQRPDRRCLSIVRVTRHHPVLGLPLVCRAATIVSLYRSHRRDRFRPIARAIDIEIGDCARSTAAGPPMFEHREGHPAPSGAGTASRLSRGHVSLALSITETATPHRSPPPPRPVVFTAHALTARIVKLARTAATDLNAKHHTPQMGRWGALRAVCSTLRRSLSPADRNHASQPARPGCMYSPHADGTDRKTCLHGGGRPQC